MQTSALSTISSQRDCGQHPSQTERLAREWAATFAELFSVRLADRGPRFVDLWVSALADLEPDVLDAACRRAMQTCKFFPAPAEIRAQIETAQQGAFEDEWQALLDYCCEWVHPDIRFSGTPSLPAEIDHAARAAGGVHFLRECSQEELGWRKKAFIEDLSRSRKTGDLAGLLTGGELRKLLNRAAQPAKQLPAPKPEERQQAIEEAAPLKRAVLHRWPSEARKAPTPEEVERQKQFVLQKYPKPGNMDGIPPELRPVEVSA